MDQTNPKASPVFRPFFRRPGIVIMATAAIGFIAGFRYKAESYKRNELAQKNSDAPNLHVSVDRSGGGI